MTEDERDKLVADEIRAGRCPFDMLKPGQTMGHCPLGFPGCACADEMEVNPFLADLRAQVDAEYREWAEEHDNWLDMRGRA